MGTKSIGTTVKNINLIYVKDHITMYSDSTFYYDEGKQLTIRCQMVECSLRSNKWYVIIYQGSIALYNNLNVPFTSSNVTQTISVNYYWAMPNQQSAGVSITGFRTGVSENFAVNLTIDQFQTITMRISLSVGGDTQLYNLNIFWIVFGRDMN